MKLFTKSSILKSTTVEIVSPRILESPNLEKAYKRLGSQSVAVEFPLLSLSEEHTVIAEKTSSYGDNSGGELLVKAQQEADDILAQAKLQASEIIAKAQQEADSYKELIAQTVRDEITPLARAEGYEKGLQEASQEAERLRKQAKVYLELAKKALMDEFHKVDRELVNLCIVISEKITHSLMEINPESLLNRIRSLTLLPYEKEGIKLHLSSEDWGWYKDIPHEDKPPYPVVVDETLKCGDVFLESSEGIFDAQIHVQLEKVKEYLIEEIEHGGLDGFNTQDEAI